MGTQKHTIWPDDQLKRINAYARSVRKRKGDRYPTDQAIRDLAEMGLKVAERRAKRRKT